MNIFKRLCCYILRESEQKKVQAKTKCQHWPSFILHKEDRDMEESLLKRLKIDNKKEIEKMQADREFHEGIS